MQCTTVRWKHVGPREASRYGQSEGLSFSNGRSACHATRGPGQQARSQHRATGRRRQTSYCTAAHDRAHLIRGRVVVEVAPAADEEHGVGAGVVLRPAAVHDALPLLRRVCQLLVQDAAVAADLRDVERPKVAVVRVVDESLVGAEVVRVRVVLGQRAQAAPEQAVLDDLNSLGHSRIKLVPLAVCVGEQSAARRTAQVCLSYFSRYVCRLRAWAGERRADPCAAQDVGVSDVCS